MAGKENPMCQILKTASDEKFTSDNIIFLLGAGASFDAGVDTLASMMHKYENKYRCGEYSPGKGLLKPETRLYNYFKEKSKYSNPNLGGSANIEEMLAIMEDFCNMVKSKNTMYRIMGDWDKELLEIIKYDYSIIEVLREKMKQFVLNLLVKALNTKDNRKLSYFHYLFHLNQQLGGKLKIFTLNHDLAIEKSYRQFCELFKISKEEQNLTTGFIAKSKSSRAVFDIENFINSEEGINLYKLHGSVNWVRDDQQLIELDEKVKRKKTGKTEFIFGISQKYKSEEPYSLLYPEFKKALGVNNEERLLVIVGYSFNDTHINNVIESAMKKNERMKVLICDPGLTETQYFQLPYVPQRAAEKIKNIIESYDYESYINIAILLHSVYYSRNFDEDALFLANCVAKDVDTISLIRASACFGTDSNAKAILNNILSRGNEDHVKKIMNYYSKPPKERKRRDRNKVIYDELLKIKIDGTGLNHSCHKFPSAYRNVLKVIDDLKVKVYGFQKHLEESKSYDSKMERLRRSAVLELIDDLRMVEKFIIDFIPVHLSLFFALKEARTRLKADSPQMVNMDICIFELYLKYNYLIDVIEIKLSKSRSKETAFDQKAIRRILTVEYCNVFNNIIEKRIVGLASDLNYINNFLATVKNNLLHLFVDKKKTKSIHNPLSAIGNQQFQDVFLRWKSENKPKRLRDDEYNHYDRVLYNQRDRPKERFMQLKVMLYSKGLAKTMVNRLTHMERILHDLISMVNIVLVRERRDSHEASIFMDRVFQFTHNYQIKNANRNNSTIKHRTSNRKSKDEGEEKILADLMKVIREPVLGGNGNKQITKEINHKVTENMNWYVVRFYTILKNLAGSLFMARFDLPGKSFGKNIFTYAKMLNLTNVDDEFKRLLPKLTNDKNQLLYDSATWQNINKAFRIGKPGGDYLNRINVCHFGAKTFFTKMVRPYTLFRTYHSVFYAEEHIRTFCDVNRLIYARYASINRKKKVSQPSTVAKKSGPRARPRPRPQTP